MPTPSCRLDTFHTYVNWTDHLTWTKVAYDCNAFHQIMINGSWLRHP